MPLTSSLIPAPILTGVELRQRRKLSNLSQPNLAAMLGMHTQSISRMECSAMAISLPHAKHIGLLFAWLDLHAARSQPVAPIIPAQSVHTPPIPTRAAPVHTRPSNPPTAEQIAQWEADVQRNSQDDAT